MDLKEVIGNTKVALQIFNEEEARAYFHNLPLPEESNWFWHLICWLKRHHKQYFHRKEILVLTYGHSFEIDRCYECMKYWKKPLKNGYYK